MANGLIDWLEKINGAQLRVRGMSGEEQISR